MTTTHTRHSVRKRKVWPWWPGAIGQQAEMPSVLFRLPGITQDFLQQGMGPPGVHPQSVGNMGFTPVAGITQPPPPPTECARTLLGPLQRGHSQRQWVQEARGRQGSRVVGTVGTAQRSSPNHAIHDHLVFKNRGTFGGAQPL